MAKLRALLGRTRKEPLSWRWPGLPAINAAYDSLCRWDERRWNEPASQLRRLMGYEDARFRREILELFGRNVTDADELRSWYQASNEVIRSGEMHPDMGVYLVDFLAKKVCAAWSRTDAECARLRQLSDRGEAAAFAQYEEAGDDDGEAEWNGRRDELVAATEEGGKASALLCKLEYNFLLSLFLTIGATKMALDHDTNSYNHRARITSGRGLWCGWFPRYAVWFVPNSDVPSPDGTRDRERLWLRLAIAAPLIQPIVMALAYPLGLRDPWWRGDFVTSIYPVGFSLIAYLAIVITFISFCWPRFVNGRALKAIWAVGPFVYAAVCALLYWDMSRALAMQAGAPIEEYSATAVMEAAVEAFIYAVPYAVAVLLISAVARHRRLRANWTHWRAPPRKFSLNLWRLLAY